MKKEIIRTCLDYFILVAEINETVKQKNVALRNQDYELAVKLRDEEKTLTEKIPTLEELKNLRDKL